MRVSKSDESLCERTFFKRMGENELDADLERAMRENVNLEQYDDIPPSKSQWPGDETGFFKKFDFLNFQSKIEIFKEFIRK